MTNVKFLQIINKNFKAFLYYISKCVNKLFPFTFNIIKFKVLLLFKKDQQQIYYLLQSAAFSIYI